MGAAGKIPNFQEALEPLIALAIGNEFERDRHIVIKEPADNSGCDFLIIRRIEEFSSYPFELAAYAKFKDDNKKYDGATQVEFEIEAKGIKSCKISGKSKYSKIRLAKWTEPRLVASKRLNRSSL